MIPNKWYGDLWRRKTVIVSSLHDTKLNRCLGLLDLIGLGLGSSLGLGVYVVTSYAIQNKTGSSFVISVIIAGMATLLASLSYAEFSTRLPRAGSSYLYTYVILGELSGFVIGWNMILEHIISGALAAKAWSQYIDFMTNGTIQRTLSKHMYWEGGWIWSECPDVLACLISVVMTVVVASGTKVSSVLCMVLVVFNVLILACFVCIGYFHVSHGNWTDPPGFFAHGFKGVLRGAASLVFTFTNIEVVMGVSEDTKDPTRTLPTATFYSLAICSIAYFCVSTASTLSLNHFPNDSLVALPKVLQNLHIHGASAVVAIGGVVGLTASVIGTLFSASRLVYAISNDKLLPSFLSKVNGITHSPVLSLLVTGSISSIVSLCVKFEILLEVVSIGTLIAYCTISVSVICLHFQPGNVGLYVPYTDPEDLKFAQCSDNPYFSFSLEGNVAGAKDSYSGNHLCSTYANACNKTRNVYSSNSASYSRRSVSFDDKENLEKRMLKSNLNGSCGNTYTRFESVVNCKTNGSVAGLLQMPSDVVLEPTAKTWKTASVALAIFIVGCIALCVITLCVNEVFNVESWWLLLIIFLIISVLIAAAVAVARQPQNSAKPYFQTPYVPYVPLLSILMNITLIAALPATCWTRFAVWLIIGLVIYFSYGYRHSMERTVDDQTVILYEINGETQ